MDNSTKIICFPCRATWLGCFAIHADDTTPQEKPNLPGKWKGEFDSQIGVQKYTFEFKLDGDKLAGKATGEREMGTNTVDLTEVKLTKDEIFFVETLKFGDNELRIEYKGKVAGDEIKLHRKVGDVAEEDFVAKRVKAGAADADGKPEMKSESTTKAAPPAAKP